MGTMKAAKLAPDAVLLPTDFDEYRRYSRLFKAAVRALTPHVEVGDEAARGGIVHGFGCMGVQYRRPAGR